MNIYRRILLGAVILSGCLAAQGQTSREEIYADLDKAGGVYYAYPAVSADNTRAPRGYAPFYISHIGRHGSRYLISDNDYTRVEQLLRQAEDADALTPEGKRLLADLDTLMTEAAGRGGDLSPLGVRQHRAIAERMFRNYPQVFAGNARIGARSTLVVRCVLSMSAFCERLKELNPALMVNRESSQRYMPVICPGSKESGEWRSHGYWKELGRKFSERHTHPDRIVNAIFSSPEFVEKYVNPSDFIWNIYWLAADGQNTEGKIDFKKYLTPEEMFDLWQVFNAGFYTGHSAYPGNGGVVVRETLPLLRDFITLADAALAGNKPSADLRFAHDGNIVPFTALLGIEGTYGEENDPEKFYAAWSDFKVSPMAANVQMVFFKNRKDKSAPVLVKVLHNEKEVRLPVVTDIYPFYRWDDVKRYYAERYGAEVLKPQDDPRKR